MAASKVARLPLMPRAERLKILNAPFPTVRVHERSRAWGGVHIRETIPTEGRRVWLNTPEDEEWCRSKWEEK